jgi:uncharacterized protein (TIGR00725 family)
MSRSSDRRRPIVAVAGASEPSAAQWDAAFEVGALLAAEGFVVACGGLGGVMDAVAQGVASRSGVSLGFLPGGDLADDDTWPASGRISRALTVPIPTGLGEYRNALLARCGRGVIAIGGGYGTLSEIGFALRSGKPVVRFDSWEFSQPSASPDDDLLRTATDARSAVSLLEEAIGGRSDVQDDGVTSRSSDRWRPIVAVAGASEPSEAQWDAAFEVGALLAAEGFVVACDGVGGVADAVAQGVASRSGVSLGFLPGGDLADDDTWPASGRISRALTVPIPTGLGEYRDSLLAHCCQGLMIAIGVRTSTTALINPAVRLDPDELGRSAVLSEGDLGQTVRSARAAVALVKNAMESRSAGR